MRTLLIVRHAKATPARAGASDFDRPLSERGVAQCEQLRAWASDLDELGRFGPVAALVSAAARTRETFDLAFRGTALAARTTVSAAIYNGVHDVSGEHLLNALGELDEPETALMVVAHNPSVTDLLWTLTGDVPREGFRTGSAYVVSFSEMTPLEAARAALVARYVPD